MALFHLLKVRGVPPPSFKYCMFPFSLTIIIYFGVIYLSLVKHFGICWRSLAPDPFTRLMENNGPPRLPSKAIIDAKLLPELYTHYYKTRHYYIIVHYFTSHASGNMHEKNGDKLNSPES